MTNFRDSEILNCQVAFEFQCPKSWDSMTQTEHSSIRYCEVCSQNVYLCLTPDEFISNGKLGRCVAIPKQMLPGAPGETHLDHLLEPVFAGQPKKTWQHLEHDKQRLEWWDKALEEGPLSFPKFTAKDFVALALEYFYQKDFKRVSTIANLLFDKTETFEILVELGKCLLENGQIQLAEKCLTKGYNLLDREVDSTSIFFMMSSLANYLVEKQQVLLAIECLQQTYTFLDRQDIRTANVYDFLTSYGKYLIHHHQMMIARDFSLKAYSFLETKNLYCKEKLISNLVEVDCFNEAFQSARLFKNKHLHKRFLSKVAERLREKGEILEAYKFDKLVVTEDPS